MMNVHTYCTFRSSSEYSDVQIYMEEIYTRVQYDEADLRS